MRRRRRRRHEPLPWARGCGGRAPRRRLRLRPHGALRRGRLARDALPDGAAASPLRLHGDGTAVRRALRADNGPRLRLRDDRRRGAFSPARRRQPQIRPLLHGGGGAAQRRARRALHQRLRVGDSWRGLGHGAGTERQRRHGACLPAAL